MKTKTLFSLNFPLTGEHPLCILIIIMNGTINIAGIELEPTGNLWRLHDRGWVAYTFIVKGPGDVLRSDLSKMIGEELYGEKICGVESYAVEHQTGKVISLAVEDKMGKEIKQIELECLRCGHVWNPRGIYMPAMCPKCKSYKWDIPKKGKKEVADASVQ